MNRAVIFILYVFFIFNTCNNKINNRYISFLKGKWRIYKAVKSSVYGMDDRVTAEWINKDVVITENKIMFNIKGIGDYNEVFKSNIFKFQKISKTIIEPERWLHEKISPVSLGYKNNNEKIELYNIDCEHGPFTDVMKYDEDTVIISYEGVYFVLKRKLK